MNTEHLRERLKHCQSVFVGHLCNGFLYDEQLAGSAGMDFTLFVPTNAAKEDIEEAKKQLRHSRDAVNITVERLPESVLNEFIHKIRGRPLKGWINSMRWIVDNKQCRKIDAEGNFIPKHKAGGQLCDLFTASRMVQIYDALNETNRKKFHNMSFAVAHHIAMEIE